MIKHVNDNLTKDEEIELGWTIQAGIIAQHQLELGNYSDDNEKKRLEMQVDGKLNAVEILSRNHYNMARKIAHSYKKSTGTRYPIEDLMQDAITELVDATYRYNPAMNCRLSTFAYQRISKKVSTEINKQRIVRLPENKMGEYLQITRAKTDYSYLEDPEMTEYDYIIETTGLNPIEIDIIMNNMQPTVSLNTTIKDSENELGDSLDLDMPDDYIITDYKDLDVSLVKVLKQLSQKERDLIAFEFNAFQPTLSYSEFLVKYNMDDQGVTRETRRAIRKMKKCAEGVK